jgi:hypothetical protein
MTESERQCAHRIATMIATLIDTGVSRESWMIEVDRAFPFASYKSFLSGLFMAEARRARDAGRLH